MNKREQVTKLLLFVCLFFTTVAAQETQKEKILEQFSRMEYMKPYKKLNTAEKNRIEQKYEKRERIYALAVKEGVQNSSEYKNYMKLAAKEEVMRLFLQKHKDAIKISDKEIKAYYQKHMRDYTTVHAYTIVRGNKNGKKEIQEYIEKLEQEPKEKQFKLFQKLAKRYSLHPRRSSGGDMGFIGYNTVVQPFGEKAFMLKEGSFTHKPFHTALGWQLVYVKERKITPLNKVKDSIKSILAGKKYRKWFKAL